MSINYFISILDNRDIKHWLLIILKVCYMKDERET